MVASAAGTVVVSAAVMAAAGTVVALAARMRPEGAVALAVGTATGAKSIDHRRANHVRLDPCTQWRTGSPACSLRSPRPIGADDPAPPNRNCRAACGLTVGCATGTACALGRHSNRGGSDR